MTKLNVYKGFLEALETAIPKKSELADLIADSLYIEKESAYRRLRGDVQFSLQEAITLAKKLNISLDKIMDIAPLKSRPFYLKLTNHADPEEIDYAMAQEYNNVLKEIIIEPNVVFGGTAKMFPDIFHLGLHAVTQFYFFKWVYQYGSNRYNIRFKDVKPTPRMADILLETKYLLQQIKTTYLILDNDLFKYFIQDVHYFYELELLNPNDIAIIAKDLMTLIDNMENVANRGVNEFGNKVDIYITNVNFETGTTYIDSEKYKLTFIRCFTLHDIASLDGYTLDTVRRWMNSLKRTSLQISESAEIQRKKFFNEQRKRVEEMSNF